MTNSKNKRGKQEYSTGDRVRLFVVYWLITFMLIVLALFSVGSWLPGWAHISLYISSLILAGIATYVHVTPGKDSQFDKKKIDEVASDLKDL